jgi:hypothetical protein
MRSKRQFIAGWAEVDKEILPTLFESRLRADPEVQLQRTLTNFLNTGLVLPAITFFASEASHINLGCKSGRKEAMIAYSTPEPDT